MTAREAYVLVVDDDPLVLNMMVARFETAGYKVTTASDAWQSVIQASGLKIGLVITDIQMPGAESGIDGYKKIRQASPLLPVIFVTGTDIEKARSLIPADPRVRLLGKPIDFAKLSAAVKELTGVDRPL